MTPAKRFIGRIDSWQRRSRVAAPTYAVIKKFGDDQANQLVVALGWYGFISIYPLLLVTVTIFGFIGAASLGHQVVSTLHQFPVVGTQFNAEHGASNLHGSVLGLVIGLLGSIYGAQGVTQIAQRSMAQVWNVPMIKRPGFVPRLGRSLAALGLISGSFLANAALATFSTADGRTALTRILVIVGMLAMNAALYTATFRILTPNGVSARSLLPGAIVGASGFTVLITVGSGLLQHQIRHSSQTYGQFGIVIGLVGFLFLLAKISLYGAELNSVLARRLWPRGLTRNNPTVADNQVLRAITHQQQRRVDQSIHVAFGDDPEDEDDRKASDVRSSPS